LRKPPALSPMRTPPEFSRIYLVSDGESNGYPEIHEIFSLELPYADLVALSAFETQLGRLSAGDELVELSQVDTMGEVEEVREAEEVEEVNSTAALDRTWLWTGGVVLLPVVVGSGLWMSSFGL